MYHGRTACRRAVSRDTGPKFMKFGGKVLIGQTPITVPRRRAPTKYVRDIRCGKILLPGKVGRSAPMSPDLSPIDRPFTSFYRQSVVTLALDRFVSETSLVFFIPNSTFAYVPPHLLPKRCLLPRVKSISSVLQ